MMADFQDARYEVIFTEHAKIQMLLRNLGEGAVLEVIETGRVKAKEKSGKFWVYKEIAGRKDSIISVSISLEARNLIVITTLVNWRPR
jgi:hypothetical protein